MNTRSGYSLLEVLIAFAIMTAVFAVLLPGQGALLKQASEEKDLFLASSYALSRLDALDVVEPLEVGRKVETYRGWNLEIVTSHVFETAGTPQHFYVEIIVTDQTGRRLASQDTIKVIQE